MFDRRTREIIYHKNSQDTIRFIIDHIDSKSMSTSASPTGFTLNDLLTRVIPGAVLIAPLVTATYVFFPELVSDSNFVAVGLLIAAYLIGEFIDQFRAGAFAHPPEFGYFIYWLTGSEDSSKLPLRFRLAMKIDELHNNSRFKLMKGPSEGYLPTRLETDFQESMERVEGRFRENLCTRRL